jgi:hypothetical protein
VVSFTSLPLYIDLIYIQNLDIVRYKRNGLSKYLYTRSENNAANRMGEERCQRGIRDNCTNTIGNYIYTTPIPLKTNPNKRIIG